MINRRSHLPSLRVADSDPHRLFPEVEAELGAVFHSSPAELVKSVDALLVNCPLHPGTERMFDAQLLATMRRGSVRRIAPPFFPPFFVCG